MRWIDRLERRLGFLAIPGLPKILVGFTALVFALAYLAPGYLSVLDLDAGRVLHGEIWRLVTYIFIPPTLSPLFVIFALWFLWWIGGGLERAMGAFGLTVYFFLGMIGTTAAEIFLRTHYSNVMLTASLFYAFAWFYPDEVIYVLLILPMKVKWMAWAFAALLLLQFIVGAMSERVALVAAFMNYFIFFGPQIVHDARHRKEVSTRRQRFESETRTESEPLHKCKVCGATESSDPNLEFRVSRDGEEYCVPHLPKAPGVSPA